MTFPGTGDESASPDLQAVAAPPEVSLIAWPVKSTTREQAGSYAYDTEQRL